MVHFLCFVDQVVIFKALKTKWCDDQERREWKSGENQHNFWRHRGFWFPSNKGYRRQHPITWCCFVGGIDDIDNILKYLPKGKETHAIYIHSRGKKLIITQNLPFNFKLSEFFTFYFKDDFQMFRAVVLWNWSFAMHVSHFTEKFSWTRYYGAL